MSTMSKTPAPQVVARILTDPHPASTPAPGNSQPTWRQRWSRRVSTFFIGLFVALIATLGVGGGTQPANAFFDPVDDVIGAMKDLFCFGTKEAAPPPMSSNADKALLGSRSPFDPPFTNNTVTAFEEYGTSGLVWSEYRPKNADLNGDKQQGCITNKFGPFIGNIMANEVFEVTRSFGGFTIAMFSWATDGDMLDSFTDPLDCVISGCQGGQGLKQTLFLNYLAPIVMFGALWGAWNGLVKKRTTDTAQGGLWMLGATVFALLFMANPGYIADQANTFVNKITTTTTNSVTSATSATVAKDDMCYAAGQNKGNRMAACSMYKAMMVTPWAAGQFGVPMSVPLEGDKSVKVGNRTLNDLRVVQIEAQTASETEIASGTDYDTIREADAELWMSVQDAVYNGVGKGANQASYLTWTGDAYSQRVSIAFSSVIATLCLGILVVLISFSTVVLAVGMILLIMLAPMFLLIGVHPGFGRGIALKWLELLLGTVVKRIVLSTVLALLVGMYQIILETPMSWFAQIAMIMALGVGAIIFRKPLLETLNVINLGGTRTGMESGMDRAGKRGAAATAGVGGGAVAGALAGGGLGGAIKGGVKGGVMGSRSGSPVRAATMGMAAGRRVGTRSASEKARAEERIERENQKGQKDIQDRIDRDPFDPEAWRDLEKWNKHHKDHQVTKPASGGSTPYPQSYRDAVDMERERRDRESNGDTTPTPGLGDRPDKPGKPGAPGAIGGVPIAPPGGVPTSRPNVPTPETGGPGPDASHNVPAPGAAGAPTATTHRAPQTSGAQAGSSPNVPRPQDPGVQ